VSVHGNGRENDAASESNCVSCDSGHGELGEWGHDENEIMRMWS
jgi:hypothetical protein